MSQPEPPIRVLFVCVHNSARSIIAEALLRQRGGRRFAAFSAGTEAGGLNPLALRVLREAGVPTDGLSSKPVQPLASEHFDYVITVCDPAREACPNFPGAGRMLHWSFDDPAAAVGTEEERMAVFREVMSQIADEIERFIDAAVAEGVRQPARAS